MWNVLSQNSVVTYLCPSDGADGDRFPNGMYPARITLTPRLKKIASIGVLFSFLSKVAGGDACGCFDRIASLIPIF